MRQVSRTTLSALKNVKFRLSRNSMKFDVIARFRETFPTTKPILSSEIKKFISDFDRNYHFTIFQKIRIFPGFTGQRLKHYLGGRPNEEQSHI